MADFNELFKKAKDTATSVASNLYSEGKEKATELKLKTDLKEAYRILGEITYNQAKGVTVDESRKRAAVSTIDGILAELANLND